MLDQKKEHIAESLDEIRDEYIEEAVEYRKAGNPAKIYRMAGAIAACLVVVVALSVSVRFSDITGSSPKNESAGAAGAIMEQAYDGEGEITDGACPEDTAPEATIPDTEMGTTGSEKDPGMAVPEADPGMVAPEAGGVQVGSPQDASSLMWYEPEEIFAQNIIIVRGTVESLVGVEGTALEGERGNTSYTQVTVVVEECLKGDLEKGDTCIMKVPVPLEYQNYYSDYYGALTQLSVGSEGIFMPRVGDPYYFGEGRRYLFLETMEGVSYAEEVYEIPGAEDGAVTLDQVEAYIRNMLK